MRGIRAGLAGGLLTALAAAFPAPVRADDAAALAKILTGAYSNARQAAADPTFEPERLWITPVWGGRSDGPWLYVERSASAAPGRPTRQQIWQLKFQPHKGGTEIRVHTLPDPAQVVGAWRDPDLLRQVVPERLARVRGCELVMVRREEFAFNGGTPAMDCAPADGAAAYVLVQATMDARGLSLWERGFDAGGAQVSGPAREGQRFDKVAIGDVLITP